MWFLVYHERQSSFTLETEKMWDRISWKIPEASQKLQMRFLVYHERQSSFTLKAEKTKRFPKRKMLEITLKLQT
jgi:hypothetical protein